MALVATLARQGVVGEIATQVRGRPLQPRVEAGIRRGIEDAKAGRMRPWDEVKRELGL
jgi:predicted transcriptional regulator